MIYFLEMFFQKMTFLNEPEPLNSNANFLTKTGTNLIWQFHILTTP